MSSYRFFEEYNVKATEEIEGKFRDVITELGEDVKREGLLKLPKELQKLCNF